jgi:putative salt-induced outer membrane protein
MDPVIGALVASVALSAQIEAMLRAAEPGELAAVAAAARRVEPAAATRIDAIVAELKARREAASRAALASRSPLDGWKGEVSASGTLTTGNTSERGVTTTLALAREGPGSRHQLNARADLQHSSGRKTRERYLLGYQPNIEIGERVFAFGLLQWERDRFAGFGRRFTESFGLGWVAVDGGAVRLTLEGGPALRQTRFVGGEDSNGFAGGTDSAEFGGRGKLDFAWTIRPRLKLTQGAGFVVGNDSNTLFANSALTAGLFGDLSVRLSFDLLHETSPPAGREETDTVSRIGVVYGF